MLNLKGTNQGAALRLIWTWCRKRDSDRQRGASPGRENVLVGRTGCGSIFETLEVTGRASRAVEGPDSGRRKRSGCAQFSRCCSCHCCFLCPGVTSPCPGSSPARSPAIPLLIHLLHLAELFGCPSGSVLSGQPQGLRVDLVQASGFWSFPEALYILVFRLPSLIQGPMFAPNSTDSCLEVGKERGKV